MVIGKVLAKYSSQRFFVQHDDMIEAFSPYRTYNSLRIRILPRRARRRPDIVHAHGSELISELGAKDSVAVSQEVFRSAVERKCFDDLTCSPGSGGMICYVEVNHSTTVVLKNDEYIEHAKRYRRNGEEIDRCQLGCVIVEKCFPALGRRLRTSNHVLSDGSLGDFDSELEQFAVNPWRTPQRIVPVHGSDEISGFFRDCRPTGLSVPDFPSPVPTEALAMPAHDGARLDNRKGGFPFRPEPREKMPEPAVASSESRFWAMPLKTTDLMSEGQDLDLSLSGGPKVNAERGQEYQK